MDPLPRAYHVFKWLSNGKIAHVNSQPLLHQCQWSFVGDILGYLKIFFDNFCDQRFLEKISVQTEFFLDGQWIKHAFMA